MQTFIGLLIVLFLPAFILYWIFLAFDMSEDVASSLAVAIAFGMLSLAALYSHYRDKKAGKIPEVGVVGYNTFKIVGGQYTGRSLFFDERENQVKIISKKNIAGAHDLNEISSLELIEEKSIDAGNAVTAGTIGLLLAGPIGALAGASLGRSSRACTFAVATKAGDKYVCEGFRQHFDKLHKAYKILHI